jgi:hypothetical protein
MEGVRSRARRTTINEIERQHRRITNIDVTTNINATTNIDATTSSGQPRSLNVLV